MPLPPSIRRLTRGGIGAVLLTGLAAGPLHAADPLDPFPINAPIASQWSFAMPWDAFFDTTREVGLFHLYDCITVRAYAVNTSSEDCIGVRAERGYEAATGQGALRFLVAERQVEAGVVGGPSSTPVAPRVDALAAGGAPGGIYSFALSGETVIRTSPFTTGDGLATLLTFPVGAIQHAHYYFDPMFGGVSASQGTYNLRVVESAVVPGTPASTVPEPSTWALLGSGLLAVAGISSRRKRTTP